MDGSFVEVHSDNGSFVGSGLQLVCKVPELGASLNVLEDSGVEPNPIYSLPLASIWAGLHSDRVLLQKVDEIRNCIGIACEGFEDQFKALFIAIEAADQPLEARSASKKERELKRLSCSINYDAREGSASRRGTLIG